MSERLTIAVDAMGGDHAPDMVIRGLALARERYPHVRYILFGDEARVGPLLERMPQAAEVSEFRHTPDAISNDAKPSIALRSGRQSSMRLAINAVADGEAGGVISAGNTGAYMATAKFALKTLSTIDRPAIVATTPSRRGDVVMLDLGANIECDAENLVQFAVMGEVFARIVLGIQKPTVGILNVGAEDLKGVDTVRLAASMLRQSALAATFHGFVEGNDITAGRVDVVVTDGFTGNVAIKTIEGAGQFMSGLLRDMFGSSWRSRLGYLLARPAVEYLRQSLDPRRYNGAMLVGLNGVAVKSHGGTDEIGFAHALGVAIDMVGNDINKKIREEFENFDFKGEKPPPAVAL
ncbi:MAG: phosphate acyltransferase PlsX [Acetobacterales bacterium]